VSERVSILIGQLTFQNFIVMILDLHFDIQSSELTEMAPWSQRKKGSERGMGVVSTWSWSSQHGRLVPLRKLFQDQRRSPFVCRVVVIEQDKQAAVDEEEAKTRVTPPDQSNLFERPQTLLRFVQR
jgi:hypothetical protein